ncbi:MAG: S-layer homology domain-containing protein, partial [Oscillospiraceae bacterium]|nr:S-layer homology domain-containing protein [Oscillospiraceae bacterium]
MKKHCTRALALLLALVMVLSAMPALSFATEEGESATVIDGLPGDQVYGVLFNVDNYVMGADISGGGAPAKSIEVTTDGRTIKSLPNGTAVIKFVKSGDDYIFQAGSQYVALNDNEELVYVDEIGTNDYAKWSIIPDQAGKAGYYNIKNVGFQYNGNPVFLEVYNGNFKPWSYKASTANLYQFKFFSTTPDEDGRVGDVIEPGPVPEDGGTYVVYNHYAKAVMGQPTGEDVAAPALQAAAALVQDGAIAYEDVADGGLIFTVHVGGTAANPVYSFENNGKYLAMPENTVDENGKTNNDETLLLIDWPTDPEKQGYAQWTLVERSGGYEMKNKAAKYGNYYCSIEFFNEVFSGWTYKADSVELFAMNFYPMEDLDGQGYVVNPKAVIDTPDPAIGSDCAVTFKLDDAGTLASVTASYQVDSNAAVSVEPEMVQKQGSFTVPAAALEGGHILKITVSASNTVPKAYEAELETEIRDEPLILSASPAANSATGEDKRPEISVTFANVGANPSFLMQLDGETVAAVASGDKLSYTPAEDLADGKHNVSVTITRTDGKSVSKNWSFFVGEGGETLYFGQIHAHTAEYSDGAGTLEDAYEHAHGVDDMDFIIVTDHSNYFDTTATATTSSYYNLSSLLQNAAKTTTKWEEARATAKEYNELYDDFLCVYGYEMTWSGGPGHTNSFNTYGVVSRNNATLNNKTGYAGMHLYNDLMVNADKGLDVDGAEAKTTRGGAEVTGVNATKYIPVDEDGNDVPVISQFNHPGKTFGNFDNFAGYTTKRDDVLNLIEVGNGEGKVGGSSYFPSYEQYDLCLSMGWHVAPTNNQDNHKGNWGDSNTCRDVILTDDFSEIGLYRALDARRVYSTEDQNLRIFYELEVAGETYKLGDIASVSEDAQPDKVTVKVNISEPDRTDLISTVEVIGEGARVLKRIDVNNTYYDGDILLDNTDGYYYVRVTEADGQIAVTAPVWVKEAVPVAAELETSASVAAQGEEETITATLTNGSESEALTLTGYTVQAEGRVLEQQSGLTETVAAGTAKVLNVPFTPTVTNPPAQKTYDITVTFNLVFKGKALTFTKTISETSYPPTQMTYIGLDRGHKNFYVSGDYANNEGSFLQICAERGIICQYIEEGQMTKENLAKYKAVVLTVPRINETTMPPVWTAEELEALADYAANGGSIINLSKSDRYDYAEMVDGEDTYKYSSANISNMVNEAIGAQTRFVRGIVVDNEKKANEAYRIYFNGRNLVGNHDFTQGIYLSSTGEYQWYNGTGITYDPCAKFTDVNQNQWYHAYVDFVLEYGLMVGTSSTTFNPNSNLTREQFVTILWRIAGSPEATVENPFTDVNPNNWAYKAILWAYEVGVTAGKSADKFDRTSNVSREQVALFLYRFAELKGMDMSITDDLSRFPDADKVSGFALDAMKWAVGNGMISGRAAGDTVLLDPKGTTTRAMGAAMLKGFVELTGETLPRSENGSVTYLVAPYDSSWVASYKANFTGSSYEPDYENDVVMAEKGSFGLVTAEQLPGGGFLVCGGACFISNYDLKYGTPSNEQYENYGLVCNILDYVKNGKFSGTVTPIADVHNGSEGQEFTVEGWITSNASDYDKDTAFFDCIYVQDETRGINCFPVSGYYFIGEKVRVHGGVTYYCGEIELNLGTDFNGSIQIISNDLNVLEPTAVSCAEAMSDANIGNLMKVSGTITEIHRTAGVIDKIYVDDGSGEQAMLFINAYIQKDSTALDDAEVGMHIEGIGIGSRDVDEESGGADGQVGDLDPSLYIKRLRVRSRDELI